MRYEARKLFEANTHNITMNALNNLRQDWKEEAFKLQCIAQDYYVTYCSALGVDDDLDTAPDEALGFLEATLRYADFLFGKYENSADVPPEKTDTIDHSSAVNELLEAIGTLRRSNEEVRDEAAQAVKDAFGAAWYLQPSDG